MGTIKRIIQDKLPPDGKVTVKVLKSHYDTNLEIKSGEAASEHFLTTALAIYNALFSIRRLKDYSLSIQIQTPQMLC